MVDSNWMTANSERGETVNETKEEAREKSKKKQTNLHNSSVTWSMHWWDCTVCDVGVVAAVAAVALLTVNSREHSRNNCSTRCSTRVDTVSARSNRSCNYCSRYHMWNGRNDVAPNNRCDDAAVVWASSQWWPIAERSMATNPSNLSHNFSPNFAFSCDRLSCSRQCNDRWPNDTHWNCCASHSNACDNWINRSNCMNH